MNTIKEALKFIGFLILIIIMIAGCFQIAKSIKYKSKEKEEMIELEKERLRLEIEIKKRELSQF